MCCKTLYPKADSRKSQNTDTHQEEFQSIEYRDARNIATRQTPPEVGHTKGEKFWVFFFEYFCVRFLYVFCVFCFCAFFGSVFCVFVYFFVFFWCVFWEVSFCGFLCVFCAFLVSFLCYFVFFCVLWELFFLLCFCVFVCVYVFLCVFFGAFLCTDLYRSAAEVRKNAQCCILAPT